MRRDLAEFFEIVSFQCRMNYIALGGGSRSIVRRLAGGCQYLQNKTLKRDIGWIMRFS